MPSNSRITAVSLFNGNTLTYSQYPDFYEFRVLKRNETWDLVEYGPFLDKTVDEVYICTGIHYIDMDSNKNLYANATPSFGSYAIVVSIRGKDTKSLNLTAKGHIKMSKTEIAKKLDPDDKVAWYIKNEFKSVKFKLT